MSLLGALAALALATPPAHLSDADITNLEPWLIRRLPLASVLEVPRGDTIFVELAARVRELPEGEVSPRILVSSKPPKVSVLSWTDRVETSVSRGASIVKLTVILRVEPTAALGSFPIDGRVEISDRVGHVFGQLPLRASLRISEAKVSAADLDLAEKAFAHNTRLAAEGLRAAPSLGRFLRPRDLDLPATSDALSEQEMLVLRGLLKGRLRAEIARDRLKAIALAGPGPSADRAARALMAPFPRPAAPQEKKKDSSDAKRSLEAALSDLAGLDFESAERTLQRLRIKEGLPLEVLAEVLAGLGAVEVIRGETSLAEANFGQALELKPSLIAPSPLELVTKSFDQTKKRLRSSKALSGHSAAATPLELDEGSGVRVRVLFGPDQHHLIDRGKIEIIGAGGGPLASREVVASRGDLSQLEAVFTPAELGPLGASIRLRASAVDSVGLEVATMGQPDPVEVPLETAGEDLSTGLPWWAWAIGGVAVAGAATAVAIGVSQGQSLKPAIGPIDVRF